MTTYKEIFGKYVRSVSSDPPAALGEGEIWYNTSSNTFKTVGFNFAWASGGTLGTARTFGGGAGDKDSGLVAGGYGASGSTADTEEYNGTSWSEQNNLPAITAQVSGCGTQTAGLKCQGSPDAGTEEYNGTAWTAGGDLNTARYNGGTAGTQTAAVTCGGGDNASNHSEEYNGSSWTEGNNLNQSRKNFSGAGSQTAAIMFGGAPVAVEQYNGTSYTVASDLAIGRTFPTDAGTGSLALAAGGAGPTNATEEFSEAAANTQSLDVS